MQRSFKVVCCYCGHINIHQNIDEPREHCEVCKEPLSVNSSWDSHSVRIYVENADQNLIENFIEEIKSKQARLGKKKTRKKKIVSKAVRKVA